jgi:hypothetical protein
MVKNRQYVTKNLAKRHSNQDLERLPLVVMLLLQLLAVLHKHNFMNT